MNGMGEGEMERLPFITGKPVMNGLGQRRDWIIAGKPAMSELWIRKEQTRTYPEQQQVGIQQGFFSEPVGGAGGGHPDAIGVYERRPGE